MISTLFVRRFYTVQGDRTPQKATIEFHVWEGRWQLKEVKFSTNDNPYSLDDWLFLGLVAKYVLHLNRRLGQEKLEIDEAF